MSAISKTFWGAYWGTLTNGLLRTLRMRQKKNYCTMYIYYCHCCKSVALWRVMIHCEIWLPSWQNYLTVHPMCNTFDCILLAESLFITRLRCSEASQQFSAVHSSSQQLIAVHSSSQQLIAVHSSSQQFSAVSIILNSSQQFSIVHSSLQ